jgi:hypothetical protein
MRFSQFACVLTAGFGAVCSMPASALCSAQINEFGACVGCRSAGPAYINCGGGCCICSNVCFPFAPSKDAVTGDESQLILARDRTALQRQVEFADRQVLDIAEQNIWAANTLAALRAMGADANWAGGENVLHAFPTLATVNAILQSGLNAPGLEETLTSKPADLRAKVTWHLDRGPGPIARLTLSSFVVDADGRMLYKIYPDIKLTFLEDEPMQFVSGEEKAMKSVQARNLVLQSWQAQQ